MKDYIYAFSIIIKQNIWLCISKPLLELQIQEQFLNKMSLLGDATHEDYCA